MRKYISKLNVKRLENKGIVLQKVTDRNKVNVLIKSLHPIKTKHRLIRLGPEGDGGYLVPDDLDGIESCFSPGVDKVSEFEYDCLKRGMKIFMADKSVEKPNLKIPEDKYDFIKKFIGYTNNEDFITMDEWVSTKNLSETSDLILQMDIEGAEYNAFINMSDKLLSRFRILVIEFHYLNDFWNPAFYETANATFSKILQTHYCVHIHPNNCCGMDSRFGLEIPKVAEFSFIRKDRVSTPYDYESNFPNELDFDNTSKNTINLPDCWYRN